MSEYLYKFSEAEVTTIRGALELARDRYRDNVSVLRLPEFAALAEQFERQAKDCEAVLEALDAESI